MLYSILIIAAGACWGSFLNVFAVRGIQGVSLCRSSQCPICAMRLSWWQLIPIVSWVALLGRCYYCRSNISPWYPIIEYITALWTWSLWMLFPVKFFLALFLLSSGLIVTIRTDAEHFLILRWCTLGLLPTGTIAAACGYLPITITQSIIGLLVGGGYLALIRQCFLWWKQYDGLGEGDIELGITIGAFIGPIGVLTTILVASCLGTAYGVMQQIQQPSRSLTAPIPFGVCLALGVWITMLTRTF